MYTEEHKNLIECKAECAFEHARDESLPLYHEAIIIWYRAIERMIQGGIKRSEEAINRGEILHESTIKKEKI